ncbi:MAG: hypothetical protein Q8K63_08890 [Acidimicrobiales bacterium]|nr:hypothetical protein [Acidimicrobiales bacterium]
MIRRLLLVASISLGLVGAGALVFVGGPNVAQAAEVPLNPQVKPDAVLNAGQTVTFKHETPLIGALLFYSPAECRGESVNLAAPDTATAPLVCKSYRIAINIDPNPKANNVVLLSAEFDQVQAPSLALVAAGLNPPPLNGVNVYVWDYEDHYLGQNAAVAGPGDPEDVPPGSASFASPERGGFKVKQRVYDITVNGETGVNTAFTLRVTYSNEVFKSPEELLDNPNAFPGETNDSAPPPVGFFGGAPEPSGQDTASFDMPQATLTPDADLAGVGLGVTESFDPAQGLALGGSTRSVSASAKAPSGFVLVLAMLLLPAVLASAAVVVTRRRQRALIA